MLFACLLCKARIRKIQTKKKFHNFLENYPSSRKNTFSSRNIKVSKYNLKYSNSFENSTYHWTSDLEFQHTGANLAGKRGQGHHFFLVGDFFSTKLLVPLFMMVNFDNSDVI